MKKLAILLLTVFTVGTVAICGCTENNLEDRIKNTENVQVKENEDESENMHECPDFPDREKRDSESPHPHRPHLPPDEKLPHPRPSRPQK